MQKVASDSTDMTRMKAMWRKLCGIALLWVGLAALVYVPWSSDGGAKSAVIAALGFFSFAGGLMLFVDALKYEIVEELRQDRGGS